MTFENHNPRFQNPRMYVHMENRVLTITELILDILDARRDLQPASDWGRVQSPKREAERIDKLQ